MSQHSIDEESGARLELSGLGLLAGPANVVMQLAWAPVGHGVVESTVESGQLFRHPWKRTRTTLTYLAVALLGSDDDRHRYRAAVNRSHAAVRSGPDSPVAYNAFDPELQMWVAACLYMGQEDIHLRMHGPGSGVAPSAYRHAAVLGTTLQVRPDQWPADRAAFQRYWDQGMARISIAGEVREYLDGVVRQRFLPWPLRSLLGHPSWYLTCGFLPAPFREQMGYEWTPAQQQRFDAGMAAVLRASRRLPVWARHFPFNVLLLDVRRRVRAGRPLV